MAKGWSPVCVVHLFKNGQDVPAVTLVKGYAVCQQHLSMSEDFFRQWEAKQDPHHSKH